MAKRNADNVASTNWKSAWSDARLKSRSIDDKKSHAAEWKAKSDIKDKNIFGKSREASIEDERSVSMKRVYSMVYLNAYLGK